MGCWVGHATATCHAFPMGLFHQLPKKMQIDSDVVAKLDSMGFAARRFRVSGFQWMH